MLIQVNFGDIDKSDALDTQVREQLDAHLGHLKDRLTRVEVHLRDASSPNKHTPNDKHCMMEARPAGMRPVVVDHDGDDFFPVVSEAASKLARVVQKTFDKRSDH